MRAFVLQDWVTIRGGISVQTVVQNEQNYLALDAYQDAIFWLQVSEVSSGTGQLALCYDTAPLKDETLFTAMTTVTLSGATMSPPQINKVMTQADGQSTPLARWVRWRLSYSSTTQSWDTTFRVMVSG